MSIWRWKDMLPQVPEAFQLTLGEGNTPLLRSRRIGPALGLKNLFFKLENCNPTGSYKDRFGVCAVSDMLANKQTLCLATSSGNTGSALAACCAAADLTCRIAIVEAAPPGKVSQMLAYGADLMRVPGFGFDEKVGVKVKEVIQSLSTEPHVSFQVSAFCISPIGMHGVQSISYEIAEQATTPVDHVLCPGGGGGLTLAIARGFEAVAARDGHKRVPHIHCVQPEGNDTIASPLRDGAEKARDVRCTSNISGLQVPGVLDGDQVITHCRASGGTGITITDDAVFEAHAELARLEGIFSEPAGAVALAGAARALREGTIKADDHVVCLVTGSAFKDPASIDRINNGRTAPSVEVAELEPALRGQRAPSAAG